MQRTEYLAQLGSESSHRTYYAQFVNSDVKELVLVRVGKPTIMASADAFAFNDVPIRRWDDMAPAVWALCRFKIRELGDSPTLSTAVCIAKEAARQIRESG